VGYVPCLWAPCRFDPVVGVEMVVPPDMLVDSVRLKLHKKSGPAVANAGRHKKEPSPAPPHPPLSPLLLALIQRRQAEQPRTPRAHPPLQGLSLR